MRLMIFRLRCLVSKTLDQRDEIPELWVHFLGLGMCEAGLAKRGIFG